MKYRADAVGGSLAVGVSFEAGIQDLRDGCDPLHGAGHENQFACSGHEQDVLREVAPMVEPGQIEDVLGRRNQRN
jgi:hypothetical protein